MQRIGTLYQSEYRIDALTLYFNPQLLGPTLTKTRHFSSVSHQPSCYHLLCMRMTSNQRFSLLYLTCYLGVPQSSLPAFASFHGEILGDCPFTTSASLGLFLVPTGPSSLSSEAFHLWDFTMPQGEDFMSYDKSWVKICYLNSVLLQCKQPHYPVILRVITYS